MRGATYVHHCIPAVALVLATTPRGANSVSCRAVLVKTPCQSAISHARCYLRAPLHSSCCPRAGNYATRCQLGQLSSGPGANSRSVGHLACEVLLTCTTAFQLLPSCWQLRHAVPTRSAVERSWCKLQVSRPSRMRGATYLHHC